MTTIHQIQIAFREGRLFVADKKVGSLILNSYSQMYRTVKVNLEGNKITQKVKLDEFVIK